MARAWTTSECGSMVKGAGANAVPPYRRLGSGGYRRGGAGPELHGMPRSWSVHPGAVFQIRPGVRGHPTCAAGWHPDGAGLTSPSRRSAAKLREPPGSYSGFARNRAYLQWHLPGLAASKSALRESQAGYAATLARERRCVAEALPTAQVVGSPTLRSRDESFGGPGEPF